MSQIAILKVRMSCLFWIVLYSSKDEIFALEATLRITWYLNRYYMYLIKSTVIEDNIVKSKSPSYHSPSVHSELAVFFQSILSKICYVYISIYRHI